MTFDVEITTALEYGTDKPCQIGRLAYRLGAQEYVALTFRYLTDKMPDPWFLTWVGLKGGDTAARLPEGCKPSYDMLAALAGGDWLMESFLPEISPARMVGEVVAPGGIEPPCHSHLETCQEQEVHDDAG